MTFAPMLDVARDPRWGRIVESPGEDPWVASEIAAAKTRGFQGQDLAAADSLAATAKHFCAYGAVTAGREYASAEVSERTLREIYLPPFSAAVAAGTAAVMPAFIDIAGAPMTANAPLLQGLAAGRPRFRRRFDQRLQRHRGTAQSWRGGRPRRGRRARPQRRRRHRHDEQRLCSGFAGGAEARSRNNDRDRRQRAARARAEGASRPFRRPVSARFGRASTQPERRNAANWRARQDGERSCCSPTAREYCRSPRNCGASPSSAPWPRRRARCWGRGRRRAAARAPYPFWKGSKPRCLNAGSITHPAST